MLGAVSKLLQASEKEFWNIPKKKQRKDSLPQMKLLLH
jgi:hypothetical protein